MFCKKLNNPYYHNNKAVQDKNSRNKKHIAENAIAQLYFIHHFI